MGSLRSLHGEEEKRFDVEYDSKNNCYRCYDNESVPPRYWTRAEGSKSGHKFIGFLTRKEIKQKAKDGPVIFLTWSNNVRYWVIRFKIENITEFTG